MRNRINFSTCVERIVASLYFIPNINSFNKLIIDNNYIRILMFLRFITLQLNHSEGIHQQIKKFLLFINSGQIFFLFLKIQEHFILFFLSNLSFCIKILTYALQVVILHSNFRFSSQIYISQEHLNYPFVTYYLIIILMVYKFYI